MPDDHSDVVPLLPIPNRTVKRVSADDSADPRVKVGHRQAITASKSPTQPSWAFCFVGSKVKVQFQVLIRKPWCICMAFRSTNSCTS